MATVPATITYAAGSATVNVPVTGVAAGSVTITATIPGYGTATSKCDHQFSEWHLGHLVRSLLGERNY